MKIFSDELSLNAIKSNLALGFRVIIDEWYWIILKAYHNSQKKTLEKKKANLDNENAKNLVELQIQQLDTKYENFRKTQIANRI